MLLFALRPVSFSLFYVIQNICILLCSFVNQISSSSDTQQIERRTDRPRKKKNHEERDCVSFTVMLLDDENKADLLCSICLLYTHISTHTHTHARTHTTNVIYTLYYTYTYIYSLLLVENLLTPYG